MTSGLPAAGLACPSSGQATTISAHIARDRANAARQAADLATQRRVRSQPPRTRPSAPSHASPGATVRAATSPNPMTQHATARVTHVHHWNDSLFSFRTTRDPGLRFVSGQFLMIGLPVDGRALMRAYSIASPAWAEHLEFFSIKVENGALTSRLQHLSVGDEILVSRKPTGTLVLHDLHPGRHLYLLGTGTGLAPFIGLVQDPDVLEAYDRIVLAHGVRETGDLAYSDFIRYALPQHEFLGTAVREKLVYLPSVTRERFHTQGRLTELIESGRLAGLAGLPPLHPARDRLMICGSPGMLADTRRLLDARGFTASPRSGHPGDYVFERAFVEK